MAFEPIANKIQPYHISNSDTLSLAQVMENLDRHYDEILTISKDENDFVSISTIIEGKTEAFYINPFTGEKLGNLIEKAPIYKFATSLHRSLFLKTTGRFLIGLTSFLLFLITLSGIVLIAKRQGGPKKIFSLIVRENFSQYFHIISSRLAFIPILILALTGVYLSLLRFSILPETNIAHEVDYDNIKETPTIPYSKFSILTTTKLSHLKELEYPFSEFVEDYYHLKLKKKEILVNQYTGEVLSEQEYPFIALATDLASVLHTGKGSIIWSVILGLGTLTIPFLMYSGFAMSIKRPRTKIKNKHHKDRSEFIILVGTEGGTTLQFAKLLHAELLKLQQSCYLAEMNAYDSYKKMEHLLIITATYGQGEAPTNAALFHIKFSLKKQKNNYTFSVVGFGSTQYPDFCEFAHATDKIINNDEKSSQLLALHTVNNKSFEFYSQWANQWANAVGLHLKLNKSKIESFKKETFSFKVVRKTDTALQEDQTFLLELQPPKGFLCKSGDLLAVYPKNNTTERLYSIGKIHKKNIQIAIKKHEYGICSNYLDHLDIDNQIEAYTIKNKGFHFPKRTKNVIMICTGTGIGPFLGMIENNTKKKSIHLYWGARTSASFNLYQNFIQNNLDAQKLSLFKPAYSRENNTKIYVQDLIRQDQFFIAKVLQEKGVIMICGSLAMQKEVLLKIDSICTEILGKNLSYYQNKKQIKMDCY